MALPPDKIATVCKQLWGAHAWNPKCSVTEAHGRWRKLGSKSGGPNPYTFPLPCGSLSKSEGLEA